MPENLLIKQQENGVCTLILNRPDRLNAIDANTGESLIAALDSCAETQVRAVLLTGNGRGFCAGQDLNARKPAQDGSPRDLGATLETIYNPIIRRIRALPKPVICAVNGVAAGAGANLALACDIVLAACSARFIQSFVNIGLVPDSGGSWLLPHLVGEARAMALAMTGEAINADKAAQWGLIWKAVPDAELADAANALAHRLAAGPTQGLALTKRLIRSAAEHDLDNHLECERNAQRQAGLTKDYAEGVAAFLEKRTPSFCGR